MTQSRAWRQYRATMVAADILTIILTYLVADYLRCVLWMRTEWPEMISGTVSSVRVQMPVFALVPFIWPTILNSLGWYAQKWRTFGWYVRTSLLAGGLLALVMAAIALVFERELYPRAQIGLVAAFTPATTMAARGITGWIGRWLGTLRSHRVLIVGVGRDAVRLRRLLAGAAVWQPEIIGHLRAPWDREPGDVEPRQIVGPLDQLGPILDREVVDEVFFLPPLDRVSEVLKYVTLCEEVGVSAQVQAESMTCHSTPEMIDFHGLPLLAYTPARHSPELLILKRVLDVMVAIVGIILTGPIMLICVIAIKLTSPGPVLFRQRRTGLNGREFHMFKFRTMDPDAEQKRAEIAHLNEAAGPVFKIHNDPRVTRIGRLLRRWSLDELPQLFNVVRGDMSIVGPRPPIPEEVTRYDRWQRRRLSMRPGLTCLWQIKGRHRIGFDEWMQLDLFYIDHWSLRLDLLILFKTAATVLSGSGA